MAKGPFSAKVSNRVATYKKRIEATFKASAQDVAKGVTRPVAKGGRMRVKTGFLRNSLMGSTASMPKIIKNSRPEDGQTYSFNAADVAAVILGASINDTIYLGFTAGYAAYREYHDMFVEAEFLKWQQTVSRNAKKAIKAFP